MSERFYEAETGQQAMRSAPAALRNGEPIAAVLREWLPERGLVLELASGTGEHAVHFAKAFPDLEWQPSDVNDAALASIEAWRLASGQGNIRAPLRLDAASPDWPRADAILSINMVHISPWAAAEGLAEGAARILPPDGPLILYGPWRKGDIATAPSNLMFDADLKSRDSRWGLRRVEDFAALGRACGLELIETRTMPANNLMLLLEKRA